MEFIPPCSLAIQSSVHNMHWYHTAWIWIWMTKRPGVTSDGNFRSCLIRRSGYGWLFPFPVGGNGNNTIYLSTFIHLNNHLDGARGTLWIKLMKDYSLPQKGCVIPIEILPLNKIIYVLNTLAVFHYLLTFFHKKNIV